MPPLYEGDLLYMPITVPGISIEEARRLLTWQDARMRERPEVARVFGKAGRAETRARSGAALDVRDRRRSSSRASSGGRE